MNMSHKILCQLLTLSLVSVISYGQKTVSVNWTLSEINSNSPRAPIQLQLGDTLQLQCLEGVYSEIIQQTFTQQDQCDSTAVGNTDEMPCDTSSSVIDVCLGDPTSKSVIFNGASDSVCSARSYVPGGIYYFTSYSAVNATLAETFGRTSEGQCSAGLKLTVEIMTEPATTEPPVSSTSIVVPGGNDNTTYGPDNGNTDNTNGGDTVGEPGGNGVGPGVIGPKTDALIGDSNSARGLEIKYLSLITAVSVLLCGLLSTLLQ